MTPDKIKEVYDTVTKQYKSTVDFYIAVPDIKTLKIKIIKYSPDLYKKKLGVITISEFGCSYIVFRNIT